jgi:hypothetical protein
MNLAIHPEILAFYEGCGFQRRTIFDFIDGCGFQRRTIFDFIDGAYIYDPDSSINYLIALVNDNLVFYRDPRTLSSGISCFPTMSEEECLRLIRMKAFW